MGLIGFSRATLSLKEKNHLHKNPCPTADSNQSKEGARCQSVEVIRCLVGSASAHLPEFPESEVIPGTNPAKSDRPCSGARAGPDGDNADLSATRCEARLPSRQGTRDQQLSAPSFLTQTPKSSALVEEHRPEKAHPTPPSTPQRFRSPRRRFPEPCPAP